MSASPTQPLHAAPPETPADVAPTAAEYVEKVRMVLAVALVASWVWLLSLWTYHAPALPGDVTGQAAGGFNMVMGVIVGYYFAVMTQGKKNDGK